MDIREGASETLVVFRATGWGRFVAAIFLMVWIGGWAVGEYFALRLTVWMLPRIGEGPPFAWLIVAFITVWLAGWTTVGSVSIIELLRMLFGRDEISISADRWHMRKGVGPLGIERSIPVAGIVDVYPSHNGASLMMDLEDRTIAITNLDTPTERKAFMTRFWLPIRPSVDRVLLPPFWRLDVIHNRRTRIAPRRVEGIGCLIGIELVFAVIAWGFWSLHRPVASSATLAAALALLVAATNVRRGWIAGPDYLASHISFLGWQHQTEVERDSLSIESHTDSDGDQFTSLRARMKGKARVLHQTVNDERTVVRLGRFLANSAGWRLER